VRRRRSLLCFWREKKGANILERRERKRPFGCCSYGDEDGERTTRSFSALDRKSALVTYLPLLSETLNLILSQIK
jgi:hypothetical protein